LTEYGHWDRRKTYGLWLARVANGAIEGRGYAFVMFGIGRVARRKVFVVVAWLFIVLLPKQHLLYLWIEPGEALDVELRDV